jgi:hypothetical protein
MNTPRPGAARGAAIDLHTFVLEAQARLWTIAKAASSTSTADGRAAAKTLLIMRELEGPLNKLCAEANVWIPLLEPVWGDNVSDSPDCVQPHLVRDAGQDVADRFHHSEPPLSA